MSRDQFSRVWMRVVLEVPFRLGCIGARSLIQGFHQICGKVSLFICRIDQGLHCSHDFPLFFVEAIRSYVGNWIGFAPKFGMQGDESAEESLDDERQKWGLVGVIGVLHHKRRGRVIRLLLQKICYGNQHAANISIPEFFIGDPEIRECQKSFIMSGNASHFPRNADGIHQTLCSLHQPWVPRLSLAPNVVCQISDLGKRIKETNIGFFM